MNILIVSAVFFLLLAGLLFTRIRPAHLFLGALLSYYFLEQIDLQSMVGHFANKGLVTLVLLMMISQVFERTNLMSYLSGKLLSSNYYPSLFRLTGAAGLLSTLMNNTAVTAALLSIVKKSGRLPASRLLLPLSYASILGGTVTLIGTSTNLLANSFVVSHGMGAIGIFDFAPIGIVLLATGLIAIFFMVRVLPNRKEQEQDSAPDYFLEIRLREDSPVIGKTVSENGFRELEHLFLAEIQRSGRLISPVAPTAIIQKDDVLVFTGDVKNVQVLDRFPGLEIFESSSDILNKNLVEVIISHESSLVGATIRDANFRQRFSAAVVAIRRRGKRLTGRIGKTILQPGDTLVLATGNDFGKGQNLQREFYLVSGVQVEQKIKGWKTGLIVGGFFLALLAGIAGVFPLHKGLLIALAVMVLAKVADLRELKQSFPFQIAVIVGSALGIAQVLEASGVGAGVAGWLLSLSHGDAYISLMYLYFFTLILTELVTNNAAISLVLPFAFEAAEAHGVSARPFVMAIAYGASASFLTPFGYQTNLMVQNPGGYKFIHYLKMGLPVSVVYSIVVLLLTPRVFPF